MVPLSCGHDEYFARVFIRSIFRFLLEASNLYGLPFAYNNLVDVCIVFLFLYRLTSLLRLPNHLLLQCTMPTR